MREADWNIWHQVVYASKVRRKEDSRKEMCQLPDVKSDNCKTMMSGIKSQEIKGKVTPIRYQFLPKFFTFLVDKKLESNVNIRWRIKQALAPSSSEFDSTTHQNCVVVKHCTIVIHWLSEIEITSKFSAKVVRVITLINFAAKARLPSLLLDFTGFLTFSVFLRFSSQAWNSQ